jgi:hypothetical protein
MGLTLFVIASLYGMWLAYVLAIHVLNRWDRLPMASRVLGAPAAIFAYLADVLLNWTLVSLLFFDPPREATITSRLHRYQRTDPTSKRARVARFVCVHLLNPFDPEHC